MKILHLVAGELDGGAAKGAYWLHIGLKELGIDSKILTNAKNTFDDESVVSVVQNKGSFIKRMALSLLDSMPQVFYPKRKNIIFSTGFFGFDFTKTNEYREADIINLHWINGGFVNIKHLAKVKKPIVWTMRDMWPITGGCHYSLTCEKYKNGCGNCSQLCSNNKFDLSKIVLSRKKKYLCKNIKLIGISHWLSDKARESYLFKNFNIRTISNNISTNEFFPIEKKIARNILNINSEKKIVLVGAASPQSFYKGFSELLKSLDGLDKNKYLICFFGNLDKTVVEKIGFEYKSFGFLCDNISLRILYSAADVFVAPSIMDAFGKTITESMSCGTPVVCFDASGPKDIVTHKIDGYRARPFESEDLARGIEWIINNERYEDLCKNARKKVEENFDVKIIAEKYKNLYLEILKND